MSIGKKRRISLKSEAELAKMRRAGSLVADTLRMLRTAVTPGMTTGELDRLAEEFIRARGGVPSFQGYHGFPASACISINEQVVHGIPGPRRLQAGDIVSIDVGAIVKGYHGDAAITVPVGQVCEKAKALLTHTCRALYAGIAMAQPGNHVEDISHAVQAYAEAHHYSVVRELVGHGIGRMMHEEPQVPNYGLPGRGPALLPGMTLAIEPMINLGSAEVEVDRDQWTVITRDRKLSAHFEHTVAIGREGPEILTPWLEQQEEPI